jgi:undecaprenyl-diphosphatase
MHDLVTFIAKYVIFFTAILVFWLFLKLSGAKKKEFIVVGLLGAVLALLLAKLGSNLYYDPRPFIAGHFTPYFPHGNDNGFPSDHTLLAGFFTFLAFRYSKKLGWLLLFLALFIGMARVKAGVHHSIDILGSFVISAVAVWLAGLLVGKTAKHKPTYTAKKSHN